MRRALLFLLLAGCATAPTSTWKLNDAGQVKASEINLKRQADGSTAATISTAHVRDLLAIRNGMSAITGYSPELQIVDGTEPNAFSGYADGKPVVGFNLGMVKLLGEDKDACAAIMGHEFAHLALGHAKASSDREAARAGVSTIAGFVLGRFGVPAGATVADLATQAVATVYSRDDEREADRMGIDLMKRTGNDPQGAVRAWEKMTSVSGFSIPFLSTHPTSAERLDTIKRLAAQ